MNKPAKTFFARVIATIKGSGADRPCAKCQHYQQYAFFADCPEDDPSLTAKCAVAKTFTFAEDNRQDNLIESIFYRTCGARGRWFEPKESDWEAA